MNFELSSAANKVYIDTNVLINYCTGVKDDVKALNYIFSKKRKEVLFSSSLSAVQLISCLQTKRKTRGIMSKNAVIEKLNKFMPKFTFISLNIEDVVSAYNNNGDDLEDCVQFQLSQKMKCGIIVTNDLNGFSDMPIVRVSPKMGLSTIKTVIF